jgi:predicted small secreted protein
LRTKESGLPQLVKRWGPAARTKREQYALAGIIARGFERDLEPVWRLFRFLVESSLRKGLPMTSKMFSVLALLLVIGTAACNTIQGAGMDIKATGNAVERAADDAKR